MENYGCRRNSKLVWSRCGNKFRDPDAKTPGTFCALYCSSVRMMYRYRLLLWLHLIKLLLNILQECRRQAFRMCNCRVAASTRPFCSCQYQTIEGNSRAKQMYPNRSRQKSFLSDSRRGTRWRRIRARRSRRSLAICPLINPREFTEICKVRGQRGH